MNVNNFKPEEKPQDMLYDIFNRQHQLAIGYLQIEKENGLLQTDSIPVDINDNKGQARIKDMFWRCTEELMEALEAKEKGEETHFYEEIGDAMHFLVEAMLLAGVNPIVAEEYKDGLETLFVVVASGTPGPPSGFKTIREMTLSFAILEFIESMGLAANCLKNKPWKQTHMPTDVSKFTYCMLEAFNNFIGLCKVAGFDAQTLYEMYTRKNQVNRFRQESGY